MTVFDHTGDLTGQEQHRLTLLYPPPEFVKEASHDRLYGDPEQMRPHLYADQVNRQFPVHSAPAVWMSTLFFTDKKASLDPTRAAGIEQRLNNAADYFSIRGETDRLKQAVFSAAEYSEAGEPDSNFALVWADEDGHKERHYPIRNAAEVKTAAAWFEQYRDEFVFEDRSRIAQKIHEKAAEHQVALDNNEMIEKTAGFGYCPTVDVVEMLNERALMTQRSHPGESAEMTKFAGLVAERGLEVRDTALRHKIASVVDQYDRVTQLTRLYNEGGLDRPEDVLFPLTEKHANDFLNEHVQMTSGTIYKKADLDGLSLDHVRTWMGDDFADEVAAGVYVDAEKVADIAPTLPRGDAEMFDQMANVAGVSPYARDKAAHATGIPLDEMHAMADAYGQTAAMGRRSDLLDL